jgi:hypothetical protein
MNNERFVVVISPRFNPSVTEENLKKFLEDNWGPGSFVLTSVPEEKSYILNPVMHIEPTEELPGVERLHFEGVVS